MKHQKLALSLLLAVGIANANNISIPTQTNLEISVDESQTLYEWLLVCNQHGEPGGNHTEKEAACSEIARLENSLDDTIEKAEPHGPCILIYRPANLTISGIVDGKQTLVVEEYPNSCVLNLTLTAAGLPHIVPFNENGSYNTGNNE
ncbi:hypothetical protein BDA99DRAFT_571135 [Phascolomyces articulosus]|uniref:Subtilisin inhibitor domain-containing protein n=1 Tax=Phascolomyces articulosus TaxID=60185 RepID=A0AAD5K2X9_9FUNG|nr:hypothetical protein BDA99DRAFT_571135 [Phascolomyces articulosus]